MDGLKINLSGLRDKVSSKLQNEKPRQDKKSKQKNNKNNTKDVKNQSASNDKVPKKFENKNTNDKKPAKKEQEGESQADILRREALELGATEEDLKLLDGVEDDEGSEQEFDDNDAKLENGFKDDLSKFMQGIGLGKGDVQVVEDDEVEEEVPELVDEEEDNEDEEDQEQQEPFEEEAEAEEEESDEDDEEEVEDITEHDNTAVFQAAPEEKEEATPLHQKIETTSILNTGKLIVPPRIDWYNIPIELSEDAASLSQIQIDRLYHKGKEALETDDATYYEEFSKTSSQKKFLSQILSGGTLNDKISALTLLIQEAPLHNTKSLDTLLGFCSKKSRNSALQSLNALKDLFINGLLPNRKLRYFKNQPLSNMLTKKQLAIFYFEDYLKQYYFKVIQILERLSHDPIIHVRMNVVSHIFDLLKTKAEQEVNLLRLGCNKIGDIDNKVSSKTSYQILQLEQAHPNMKKIVIDAVVDNVFKQNSDYHTKYYSVLTLNQTILTRREDEVANVLVKTYFALFEKLLIESDPNNVEHDNKKDADSKDNNYKNRKKNFKKGKKGGKSVKSDKSDQEVMEEKNSKLFSALLTGLNRAFPFSNLPTDVFNKHLETLYKITHSSNFNTSVQALVLISQIVKTQNLNSDRFYRTLYESLFDPRLVTSSKQGIYLNLLYKALKQDANTSRTMAFVKRIVQICYNWVNVGSIAGMFFLLMELEKSIPQIRNLALNTPVDHKYVDDEDSEEENFKDVDSDNEDTKAKEVETKKAKPAKDLEYDGRKRDPRFANAGNSSLWEINEFLNHYHPTVQLYAESFLNQQKQVKPDLGLFTLSHFLDRFVYRNAKQKPTTKGSSIMQPLGGAHTGSLLVKATNKINPEVPVNTEDWLAKRVDDVRPDEKFFHQYFTTKEKDPSQLGGDEPAEEDFDQESDLDDAEVWDALVKSQPEIEGEDEDSLDDFSDLDEDAFSDYDDDEEDEEVDGETEQQLIEQEEDEDSSDFELQAIGDSDDDEEDEEEQEQDSEVEDDFKGPQFDDDEVDEDDNEAELFKGDSEDEIASDEEFDEESEEEEKAAPKSKKRSFKETKTEAKPSKKSKKSKFSDLPVFASADDYSQYLNSDDEDFS